MSSTAFLTGILRTVNLSLSGGREDVCEAVYAGPMQRQQLFRELRREGELDARDTGNDARRGEAGPASRADDAGPRLWPRMEGARGTSALSLPWPAPTSGITGS